MATRAIRSGERTDRRPRRLRGGTIGAFILTGMLMACLGSLPHTLASAGVDGSGMALPARYRHGDLNAYLLPPTWAGARPDEAARAHAAGSRTHWLGTDRLGRDVLVRCLAGGGISIGIGLASAAISLVIGTLYGSIAALAGGRIDAAMMRVVDILFGLPYVLLAVLLALAGDALVDRAIAQGREMPEGTRLAIEVAVLLAAIGGISWLTLARVVRAQVQSLRARPYMEAARALGLPARRQFLRHLLPNLSGTIIVYASLTIPQAILQESFLSFLGIGVRPPMPSWGSLAAEGLIELNPVRMRWWLILFPCVLLGTTLFSLNLVGEGLREALDPKRSGR